MFHFLLFAGTYLEGDHVSDKLLFMVNIKWVVNKYGINKQETEP